MKSQREPHPSPQVGTPTTAGGELGPHGQEPQERVSPSTGTRQI